MKSEVAPAKPNSALVRLAQTITLLSALSFQGGSNHREAAPEKDNKPEVIRLNPPIPNLDGVDSLPAPINKNSSSTDLQMQQAIRDAVAVELKSFEERNKPSWFQYLAQAMTVISAGLIVFWVRANLRGSRKFREDLEVMRAERKDFDKNIIFNEGQINLLLFHRRIPGNGRKEPPRPFAKCYTTLDAIGDVQLVKMFDNPHRRAIIRQALELCTPNSPFAHQHLAEAISKLGLRKDPDYLRQLVNQRLRNHYSKNWGEGARALAFDRKIARQVHFLIPVCRFRQGERELQILAVRGQDLQELHKLSDTDFAELLKNNPDDAQQIQYARMLAKSEADFLNNKGIKMDDAAHIDPESINYGRRNYYSARVVVTEKIRKEDVEPEGY
ncbi:MAG: hypothetical protein R3A13_03555 [Bdellovibrionota bacterium]